MVESKHSDVSAAEVEHIECVDFESVSKQNYSTEITNQCPSCWQQIWKNMVKNYPRNNKSVVFFEGYRSQFDWDCSTHTSRPSSFEKVSKKNQKREKGSRLIYLFCHEIFLWLFACLSCLCCLLSVSSVSKRGKKHLNSQAGAPKENSYVSQGNSSW